MTEIPMADDSGASGQRPKEVTMAAFLVLLNAIAGVISGGVMYYINEDWTAGLGFLLAVVAFWLYFQIQKQDHQAWMFAVIFLIIGIFLYAVGENWAGVLLCLITVIYLNLPNVKQYFE
ncbi:MAG: hypothetical protein EAX95_14345 [Candidatus Thorarchaeota archaeon]|nr:hypothetical protein [Candidatus Thorarchaeota archaeon]